MSTVSSVYGAKGDPQGLVAKGAAVHAELRARGSGTAAIGEMRGPERFSAVSITCVWRVMKHSGMHRCVRIRSPNVTYWLEVWCSEITALWAVHADCSDGHFGTGFAFVACGLSPLDDHDNCAIFL